MFKRILVLVDDSDRTVATAEAALAPARIASAHVTFLCVLSSAVAARTSEPRTFVAAPGQIRLNAEAAVGRVLAASAQRARATGVNCSGLLGAGITALASVREAVQADGSDLLVLARTDARPSGRAGSASLHDQVLAHVGLSVLLV